MGLSRVKMAFFALLLCGAAHLALGANVFITTMELTSRINLDAEIETRGLFQVSFDGGYKYQGKLLFQYYNTDLENNTSPALIFDGAQASIQDIFNVLDLTYWTGFYGILGEGRYYKGHLYHREAGFDYNGYLPVLGTGLVFSVDSHDTLFGQTFIYQRYGTTYIDSLDLLFGVNKSPFVFQFFAGTSDTTFRLGSQFQYLGSDVELYLTIGDPTLEMERSVDFDDFYFLMEQWFKMKNWNLILSVFTRPSVHYNYVDRDYVDTDEENDIDFNFNLNYEPEGRYFSGGTELNIQTNRYEDYLVAVSPYISIFTSGLIWKIKVDFNVLSPSRNLVTAYLNIRASF